jgi:multicomponent Na+:H+ antiporter subunit B
MTITAFAIVCFRQLFAVVILSGIFSLLAASLYVLLTAVDVAFTEASVGAGISTLLL